MLIGLAWLAGEIHHAERFRMKIVGFPFTNVVWDEQTPVISMGESGTATSRSARAGDVCLRMVEFSPGYRADHWCAKGHAVLVLEGSLTTIIDDGSSFLTTAGQSFLVGDDSGRHLAHTEIGAKVFIVD